MIQCIQIHHLSLPRIRAVYKNHLPNLRLDLVPKGDAGTFLVSLLYVQYTNSKIGHAEVAVRTAQFVLNCNTGDGSNTFALQRSNVTNKDQYVVSVDVAENHALRCVTDRLLAMPSPTSYMVQIIPLFIRRLVD